MANERTDSPTKETGPRIAAIRLTSAVFFVIATLLVFGSSDVHADNAPMWESPEGLAPGSPSTTVRMADEQVDLKVIEQNGNPTATVNASFDMDNDGPTVQLLTGFPDMAYSAVSGDYDPVTFTPANIVGFRAWTDSDTYNPTQRKVDTGRFGGSDWFVWTMTYPQGKTVQVHVSYQQKLDAWNGSWAPVSYVLRTGALWNGPIGKATITMSTSDGGTLVDADPAPQQTGSALTWTFSNFKPVQDINATYIEAASWSKLQAAQNAASAPGASTDDLVAGVQAVLDTLMGPARSPDSFGTLYLTTVPRANIFPARPRVGAAGDRRRPGTMPKPGNWLATCM